MKPFKNLRGKLFFWYITSLITVTAFFYFAVHIYSLPYRNIIFFALLIFLALEGFFIVRKMTDGLSKLSSKIKTITSKNLSEKVIDIESEDEIGELASAFNQLLDYLKRSYLQIFEGKDNLSVMLHTNSKPLYLLNEVVLRWHFPRIDQQKN